MSILSTVRDLDRLRVITQVLIRHGFGHLAVKMGLPGAKTAKPPATKGSEETDDGEAHGGAGETTVEAADGQPVPVPAGPQLGERLRLVLQDLGTTFVKLGQIVSTRPDLVPEDIVVELKKLQDDVKPFPTEQAREVIERELGAPIDELFADFGEEPLACASVAQVYRAELKLPATPVDASGGDDANGGEEEGAVDAPSATVPVVIKVQRPGIEPIVERDINLLHWLARLLEATVPEARVYSPNGLVDEFEQAIKAELDFIVEAQNAERFAENFAGDETIRFPRAYREASSKRVLTLEYFDGVKVTDAVRAGADGPWIAETSVRLILKMVFEDGFFHADPHPGNILILPRPKAPEGAAANAEPRYGPQQQLVIGLLDLGLVGRLSPELRDKTTDLLLAAARNDADALADALLAIGKPRRRVDREAFREYTRRVSEAHLGKEMKDMEAAAIFRDIISGALKFGIEIPSELTMLFRAIMTIEGVGKEIDPELDVLAVARPYLVKMLWQRYHPTRLAKDFWRDAGRLSVVARELPAQLSRIIEDLQRGDFRVKTEDRARARALERLGRRLRATAVTITTMASGVALLIANRYTDLGQGLLLFGMAWMVLHFAVDYRHQKRDTEDGS